MEEPLDVVGLERQLYPRDPDAIKDLVIFRRQYLQRINVKHITWPSAELLRIYDVQRWIYQWIASFMPTESNTKQEYNVLSELLRRIELAVKDAEEPDIYDPLFEICAEMCLHVHGPEAETVQRDDWVSYAMSSSPTTLADESIVKLIEKPRVLSAGGCSGYRTWQAALALASIISVHGLSSGLFRGRKILELGAGTGLLSFICASDEIGATVISTDGDETAVSRLQISASANGHSASDNSASFRSGQYLWGTPFEDTIIGDHLVKSSFDLVIASDVTYDPLGIPDLVKTIARLLELNSNTVAVVGATLRNEATFALFTEECARLNLHIRTSPQKALPWSEQTALFVTENETVMVVTIAAKEPDNPEMLELVNMLHTTSPSIK